MASADASSTMTREVQRSYISPVNRDKKKLQLAKDQGKFIFGNFVHFEVLMKTLDLRPQQAATHAAILKKCRRKSVFCEYLIFIAI